MATGQKAGKGVLQYEVDEVRPPSLRCLCNNGHNGGDPTRIGRPPPHQLDVRYSGLGGGDELGRHRQQSHQQVSVGA